MFQQQIKEFNKLNIVYSWDVQARWKEIENRKENNKRGNAYSGQLNDHFANINWNEAITKPKSFIKWEQNK